MPTKGILCDPRLSGLHGVIAVGVNGNSEIRLVLAVELEVTFDQDEHAPWFKAPNELSDGFGVICNLRGNTSARLSLIC